MEISQELWKRAVALDEEYIRKQRKLGRKIIQEKLGVAETIGRHLRAMLDSRHVIEGRGKKIKRRIFLGGDLHCGHIAGLTPEPWQQVLSDDRPKVREFAEFQRETWLWFYNEIEKIKPFDVAIWNGDLIDGRQERSGGTELLVADREDQADIAKFIIRKVNAEKNAITYGTAYHTGKIEDWENRIAEGVRNPVIKGELNLDIGGVIFNVKHHTGGSSVPHGEATAIMKDALWSDLWADFENRPKADVVARSHVHTFIRLEDRNRIAMKLPALQGAMTKYGNRRCVKIVDFGFMHIDIYDDGTFKDFSHLYRPGTQKNELITL